MWTAVYSRVRVELYRFGPRLHVKAIPGQHWDLIETISSQDAERIRAALQDHILTSAAELFGPNPAAHGSARSASFSAKQHTPSPRDQDSPPEEKARPPSRRTGLRRPPLSRSEMLSGVDAETFKKPSDVQ